MPDAIEAVLRLVAEGRLTADEAGPILDALSAAGRTAKPDGPTPAGARPVDAGAAPSSGPGEPDAGGGSTPRVARIEVMDGGKRVVDLRIPISLGRFALNRIPGLSAQHIADVEQAVASGSRGPILEVQDEDGDGVRIVLE